MHRLLLEVIVQSVADARAAAQAGADRLEVVRAIRDGGLTPDLNLVRAIAAETSLPLRVMVRENAGFATTPEELRALQTTVGELSALGVDGIVLGFLRDGELALDDVARVLEHTPELRVTFHRAFDSLSDPLNAIDRLAGIPPIDKLLTSGGDGTPSARCGRLRSYAVRAGGALRIVAGGGVDAACIAHFAAAGCVGEVHVGRAARVGDDPEGAVSVERTKRLREIAG